jgi:hypothetical protein
LTGQCKFDGNLFCFFFPLYKKDKGNPTHIAAYLQTRTSQRYNQSFTKECNFSYTPIAE